MDKGIHWKNCELLTSSKSQGGLGFKDFNHMNFIIHQVSEFTMIETQGQLSGSTKIIGGTFGNRRKPPREGVFNINLNASFIPLLVAFKGVLL